jgi:hypothetical protein
MTIPYSSTIPNPPNDPADDVSAMQTNAGSISTIIAVDHVGFNVSGGGQHAQVTFNSNNPPTPPVSPPILFTNNQDGAGNNLPGSLAELFFYSGSAAQSKNQYNVSATNGSVMLPMGIILKWGTDSFTGSAGITVNFTNAFPNNCFGVQISLLNTGGTQTQSRLSTYSASGFTGSVNASGSCTLFWWAIGN